MKKTLLTLAIAAFTLSVTDVVAQDKVEATTERFAENIQKEADAYKKRITDYVAKLEANKENPDVDYEAGMAQVAEMKAKWEELTGKTWKEEEKKK
ncbi:MAG: hypothetical protein H6603_07965 [Flavobacteriales bacterium]|nr:hypothetical protein [Flavobacteriales bacterium]MCB9204899.1 hypothetical protein [Flavobacteriales bacterium]